MKEVKSGLMTSADTFIDLSLGPISSSSLVDYMWVIKPLLLLFNMNSHKYHTMLKMISTYGSTVL